jgi:RNA polymerase sigma-70 factor (ECF subfamily)
MNRDKVEVGKTKSWLFTCANNAMINFIQKKNRACEFNETLHEKGAYDKTHFESTQVIQHVVSILPPLQKSILLLRDLEGYAYDEIGDILNLSAAQVKVYLFRARMKMKKQLTQLNELA